MNRISATARPSSVSVSRSARASSLAGRTDRKAAPPRGSPTTSKAVPSPRGQWRRKPVP